MFDWDDLPDQTVKTAAVQNSDSKPMSDPATAVAQRAENSGGAASVSRRPVRVLCFHGTAANGKILQMQLARVSKHLGDRGKLICVNSPCPAVDGDLLKEQRRLFSKLYGPDMYEFHPCVQPGKGFVTWPSTDGWDSVEVALSSYLEVHAPIDGVLGFSEGANAASVLVAKAMTGAAPSVSFAVHLNGARPDWTEIFPELFKEKIKLRSLHTCALQDDQVPTDCALRELYEQPICLTHGDGHKPIPSTSREEADRIAAAIAEFILSFDTDS